LFSKLAFPDALQVCIQSTSGSPPRTSFQVLQNSHPRCLQILHSGTPILASPSQAASANQEQHPSGEASFSSLILSFSRSLQHASKLAAPDPYSSSPDANYISLQEQPSSGISFRPSAINFGTFRRRSESPSAFRSGLSRSSLRQSQKQPSAVPEATFGSPRSYLQYPHPRIIQVKQPPLSRCPISQVTSWQQTHDRCLTCTSGAPQLIDTSRLGFLKRVQDFGFGPSPRERSPINCKALSKL
jgi:hypothetical protein